MRERSIPSDDWVDAEAEALLDRDGRRERVAKAVAELRGGTAETYSTADALAAIARRSAEDGATS